MRIGFDAFPLQKNPSGIGKYVMNIIEEIIKNIPDSNYFAYSNREVILSDYCNPKVKKREFYNGLYGKMPGKVWLKAFAGKHIKNDNLDFFISTTGFFPILPSNVKRIVMLHDFNAKLVPKTMGKMHYLTHLIYFEKDVLSADFVISNSLGTADKLFHYFKKKTDEIINPPVSAIYHQKPQNKIDEVLNRYKIKRDYILFVGNLEPRKNLTFVLNNFIELLEQKKISNVELVIVGLKGWNDTKIQVLLNKYSDNVRALGYVSELDLPVLYSGAKVFVFPSLYEGFGIPVREALLSGTPVITSDIPELREAGSIALHSDMVVYVDPADAKNFKKHVIKYIDEKNVRKASINPEISIKKLCDFLQSI
ncbi:glycosyltransferase family 4 protein [Chryseobacterium indoltheticum]|uniref:Glycosyltransferase involved in cell wall bisynthesis n=1 Tax=Chryseobacterium indoltheticum TaxID=254 RepID=A0A381F590_9FLAO|nr:glycosyltransferase family 1 protein [Chryseobacterium indoltheticum]AZA75216.1 glycosyltransferase family 1 protein [Chryseobacterium indoltheticum]SIR14795.1 Glycosyltransferase involved in cell wall bisynthesis [Chryseobacterium indoltheticum]SUX41705.1 Mannosylfructose-phosphate synthase [Chryseobacterium indoltheticum]